MRLERVDGQHVLGKETVSGARGAIEAALIGMVEDSDDSPDPIRALAIVPGIPSELADMSEGDGQT